MLIQDAEIDRILKAFRLNAYAVLDLQPGCAETDIKKCYRTKSLLIHPDKTTNPSAPDAFDRLAKAQQSLLDEKQRNFLDECIADARRLIIREKKWTLDEPRLREESFWREEWQEKAKTVLIDEELRRRKQAKAQMQEEGRQQRKEEEELQERKRKREHEQKWEASREERIGTWRDFQKKTAVKEEAKKKKKLKVLG